MEPDTIYNVSLSVVAGFAFALLVGAAEVGRRFGAKLAGTGTAKRVEVFEASLFGMLSLMIGFTFSLALSRYEARKSVVLDEANSIGTVALRGRMLPAPHDTTVRRLVREYATQRLTLGGAAWGSPERAETIDASLRLQESLWHEAVAVVALDTKSVPAGLFADAVNHLYDMHEARVTADRNHVPQSVLLLLYGIAIVAIGFAGYTGGVAGAHNRWPTVIMVATIVIVITLVMDLDRPRRGLVTVSQQPMLDLIAGL